MKFEFSTLLSKEIWPVMILQLLCRCFHYLKVIVVSKLSKWAFPMVHWHLWNLHLQHLADDFVQSDLQFIHWWWWLPWEVLTSTLGAAWGSASCQRTLPQAHKGNRTSNLLIIIHWLYPWATLNSNRTTYLGLVIRVRGVRHIDNIFMETNHFLRIIHLRVERFKIVIKVL